MKTDRTSALRRSVAESRLGVLAIGALTVICLRLQIYLAIVAILFLALVVLLEVAGGFVPSILVSAVAVGSLDLFLTKPPFSFSVHDPFEVICPVGFLTIASITSVLMSQRRRLEATLRWLSQNPPRLDQVRASLERLVREGNRASDVIRRIRARPLSWGSFPGRSYPLPQTGLQLRLLVALGRS